jgi:hypothetical protein
MMLSDAAGTTTLVSMEQIARVFQAAIAGSGKS